MKNVRFPRGKKGDAVEKQQYINEYPLKVNPTIVLVPADIIRERFRVFIHRNRLMEPFRTCL
ncbi:MAG: hypothetical protein EHM53_09470 [Methanoregulaceae archaeon]|nr:MAG: hypothetical protein EHM53_09470 [Methanoregulaceae archaeon]